MSNIGINQSNIREWIMQDHVAKGIGSVVVLIGLVIPLILSPYYLRTATFLFMWIGLASSWNIVGGYIEYPSFGHVAFFGIGAFIAGIATNRYGFGNTLGIEFLILLLGAGVLVAIISLLLGPILLRLRSHYFAIAMLGVAEALNAITKFVPYFSGVEGFTMPLLQPPFISSNQLFYYVMGILALGTIILAYIIKQTKLGHGFAAIREDEDASRMIGVPTIRYKLYAFVLSTIPPAMIGVIWSFFISYFNASSAFPIDTTITMIVMALIGGLGTVTGPIIGAGVFYLLQTYVWANFLQFHRAIMGVIIIAFVLLFPKGIVGAVSNGSSIQKYINQILPTGGELDESTQREQ
jgi:branched-chain amino acid transport system permease protein